MNRIGIFQGRLSPPINGLIQAFPWDSWEQEFNRVKEVNIDFIDWIVGTEGFYKNPLLTSEGVDAIKRLMKETGVSIDVVSAYYFMEYPLLRCTTQELADRLDILDIITNNLDYLNVKYLELPFEENSEIRNKKEFEEVIVILESVLDRIPKKLTLSLETSLTAKNITSLLKRFNNSSIKINYDTGNAASYGFNPYDDIKSYGKYIATIHIKDRLLGGKSVPLGHGDTDFATCFATLKSVDYSGPYIFQTARSHGNEMELAEKNLSFINTYPK